MNRTHKIVLVAIIFLLVAMFFSPAASNYIAKKSKYMAKNAETYVLNPAGAMCPNCITGTCDEHGKCS